jgi:hypothetical protein
MAEFDEFIEELEDDIKKAKVLALWNRYQRHIMAGIAAIALIGASTWYYHYKTRINYENDSQKFSIAQFWLAEQKEDAAYPVLEEIAKSDKTTYALFSKLLLAASFKKTDLDKSLSMYEHVWKEYSAPREYKEFALLQALWIKVNQGHKVMEDLKPLLKSDSVWYYPALELKAYSYFHEKEYGQAVEAFAEIAKSDKVTRGLMVRARLMVQKLSHILDQQNVDHSAE